ncbi:MAG: DinB family protein [Vicinamibacterales bacterium]
MSALWRVLVVVAAALGSGSSVGAQAADPLTGGARVNYGLVKDLLVQTAMRMTEEGYAFAPTPDSPSFGQLIGHVADANYRFCSAVAGDRTPLVTEIEATMTRRFELRRALDLSFAFCDKQYTAMTDAGGARLVSFDGGEPDQPLPLRMPRLSVLAYQTQHAFEHLGMLVTYLRLRGIAAPTLRR